MVKGTTEGATYKARRLSVQRLVREGSLCGQSGKSPQPCEVLLQLSSNAGPKAHRLMPRVRDLEFVVTDSEQEAIILEFNFIKKHQPRFNVRLKDDKSYPYIKVALNE